ncbi:MAG TPA: hemerythrin domain-containing protein [Propionibacteriaceae bacterium]|nr:hemerythrin domain-containing protein [Propionibacteriaceae bacterium]
MLTRKKRDHVKLDHLLTELAASDLAHQNEVLRHLYRLVFPHAFAEEAVLWPVVRRVLPDGQDITLRVEREHQEVNELVTALEAMPMEDPARPTTRHGSSRCCARTSATRRMCSCPACKPRFPAPD